MLELNLDLDRQTWASRAWPAVSCACTSAQLRASARRTRCSTRARAATSAAPTSSSASSRRTTAPNTIGPDSATSNASRAGRSRIAISRSRRWTSTPSSLGKPTWALVDELAHTNVPGSRNTKRWQDIDELLDAGINVISTVNIQHLESLNDVVERITGIKQRETVPDAIVRRADQIELVDMTPEALRRRMAHGNIYAADKVDAALGNYFRVGNLAALRELALLWMADRVDETLHEYRERHGIDRPWETKERVRRRAHRRARRRRPHPAGGADGACAPAASWSASTWSRATGWSGPSASRLADAPRAARGGRRALRRGAAAADVAQALVQAARAENATQLDARRDAVAAAGPSSSAARSSTRSSAPPAVPSTCT